MKAVILAGGKGSRLPDPDTPKAMQKIGDRCLLEHQFTWLKKYGCHEILLLTSYLHTSIASCFGDGQDLGIKLKYFRDPDLLGTAGALKAIAGELDADFLLVFGDIMQAVNLEKLFAFHKTKQAFCTCVVHPNDHPADSDLVEIDTDKRITALHAKPHAPGAFYGNLANAALLVLQPALLDCIPANTRSDLGRDILPSVIHSRACYAYQTREYLKDIGTPARLEKVRSDYLSGTIALSTMPRKAVFLDRDGTINYSAGLVNSCADFRLLPGAAAAIRRINHSEYLSVVVTNQPVIARNLCTPEELQRIHIKMETLLGNENAYLDRIYFCPHHPDKGYPGENPAYKIACRCRKPGTGMIEQAVEEMNIELDGSWIVGDSEKDIRCGKNAGIKTIRVTGKANTQELPVTADYTVTGLAEAIAIILGEEKH